MNGKSKKTPSASPLFSSFWTVGFTGYRELGETASVSQRIREVLDEIPRRISGRLVALSSVASGADILFIEQALAVGLPWFAILPMPPRNFFNNTDFPDAKERERAECFLNKAVTVEIASTPGTEEEARETEWRKSSFTDAGFRMVDDSDILIAVLRLGDPGRGPGGTADVVRYAEDRKRPRILIDPDTNKVEWFDFPQLLIDPLMDELLSLQKTSSSGLCVTEKAVNEIGHDFADFFSIVDAAALRKVPLVRNAGGAAVILHTAAMIVAAFVLTLLASGVVGQSHPSFMTYATWIKAGLVTSGFITLVWIMFFKPQTSAARYRLVAEFCRSVIATRDFPSPLSALYRTPFKEFRHFCRSLLIFRLVAQVSSKIERTPWITKQEDIATFRSNYLSQRIRQQLNYYRKKWHSAHPKSHWCELLAFTFSSVALICTLWLAFTIHASASTTEAMGQIEHAAHHASRAWLEFGMVAAPVLASLFVASISIFEWKRQAARYTEMIAVLEDAEHKIGHTMNTDILERVVVETERELLAENIEWYCMTMSASSV